MVRREIRHTDRAAARRLASNSVRGPYAGGCTDRLGENSGGIPGFTGSTLFREGMAGELKEMRYESFYISPLKALSNDIRKNLEETARFCGIRDGTTHQRRSGGGCAGRGAHR